MRRPETTRQVLFSKRSLKARLPANHPLSRLRVLVDDILAAMHASLEHSRTGIPSERLLRASLIQVRFSIRSDGTGAAHTNPSSTSGSG